MIKQISTHNGSSWSTYDIGLDASHIKLTSNIYGVSSSTGTIQDVMSSWLPSSTISNGQLIGTDSNNKLTGINISFTEIGYIQDCSSSNSIESILRSLENTFLDFEDINLIDKIYPIGSIYTTTNNTNPSTLFGGTWQVMSRTDNKPFYLLGSGVTAVLLGGTDSLTLTNNNLPLVTGSDQIRGFRTASSTTGTIWNGSGLFTTTGNVAKSAATNAYYSTSVKNPYKTEKFTLGSSKPIDIDPVNISVIYWERIA